MVSLKQTLKDGYSLLRFLEYQIIDQISLTGSVIDLGAKSENINYFNHLKLENVEKVDYCDLKPLTENMPRVNLEKPFDSIRGGSYDHVLNFNVLEHIYNYKNVIDESFRILKAGGVSHCMVPFMWNYHGDPDDFNRFTHTALYRKYSDAGFDGIEIWPIGGGFWMLIASLLSRKTSFWWMKYIIIKIFTNLDKFEQQIVGKKANYALAFYVKAKKCL